MNETIKTAIINNLVRIAFLGIVALCALVYHTIEAPVMKVMHMTENFEQVQEQIENNDSLLQHILKDIDKKDSTFFMHIGKLQDSDQALTIEVGTIKTCMQAIREEIPALHKRFNDIEQAVSNTNNQLASINPQY